VFFFFLIDFYVLSLDSRNARRIRQYLTRPQTIITSFLLVHVHGCHFIRTFCYFFYFLFVCSLSRYALIFHCQFKSQLYTKIDAVDLQERRVSILKPRHDTDFIIYNNTFFHSLTWFFFFIFFIFFFLRFFVVLYDFFNRLSEHYVQGPLLCKVIY
jgi:hypothetical protein